MDILRGSVWIYLRIPATKKYIIEAKKIARSSS
jgi:hypothetical protein